MNDLAPHILRWLRDVFGFADQFEELHGLQELRDDVKDAAIVQKAGVVSWELRLLLKLMVHDGS